MYRSAMQLNREPQPLTHTRPNSPQTNMQQPTKELNRLSRRHKPKPNTPRLAAMDKHKIMLGNMNLKGFGEWSGVVQRIIWPRVQHGSLLITGPDFFLWPQKHEAALLLGKHMLSASAKTVRLSWPDSVCIRPPSTSNHTLRYFNAGQFFQFQGLKKNAQMPEQ